jgi:NAD-dependent oxidoreductase involved in siderophore biosynthesis
VDLSHLSKAAPALAKKGNLVAILSLPLGAIRLVLNYGPVIWADLGCGLVVVVGAERHLPVVASALNPSAD